MGVAVAAAGSLAGAYAYSKVEGALTPDSKEGGGIPGVLTSKGGGKDGDTSKNFPQVDSSIALDYFKQAADEQKRGYTEGLGAYAEQMKRAVSYITAGFTDANNTLKPLSYASGQALNEQMRMMGMDPLPATSGFSDTIRSTYNDFVREQFPDADGFINKLSNQMDQADKLKDPAARAEAKRQIQEKFGSFDMNLVQPIKDQLAQLKEPTYPDYKAYGGTPTTGHFESPAQNNQGVYHEATSGGVTDMPNFSNSTGEQARAYMDAARNFPEVHAKYLQEKAALEGKLNDIQTYSSGLRDLGSDWSNQYGDTYDAGYTGDQVLAKIQSTPGYDFTMKSGTQALNRQAAASGMLNSGNTGVALQEYGQGLASNYYNQYMTNLQSITAAGTPATMQISANQSNLGSALGGIAQSYGAAKMDTYRSIADYSANSLMKSGDVFNQTAMFNAGLQFQGQQNELDRKNKTQGNNTAAAPGLAAVANNAYQYNNNFTQGLIQQASANAGFLRGMN